MTADDCRACSIPAAVSHKDACLYLTPLRHEGRSCYACRWFFSSANEPVVDDWRNLCFCSYWFPRGNDEEHVLQITAPRRMHYLKVLRGEAPRRMPRTPAPAMDRTDEPPHRRSTLDALAAICRRLGRATRSGPADR